MASLFIYSQNEYKFIFLVDCNLNHFNTAGKDLLNSELLAATIHKTSSSMVLVGGIYYAQVTDYNQSLNCYFVHLGNGKYGMLPVYGIKSRSNKLTVGQKLYVTIKKAPNPVQNKLAVVLEGVVFYGMQSSYKFSRWVGKSLIISGTTVEYENLIKSKILSDIEDTKLCIQVYSTANIKYLLQETDFYFSKWITLAKENPSNLGQVYQPSIILNLLNYTGIQGIKNIECSSVKDQEHIQDLKLHLPENIICEGTKVLVSSSYYKNFATLLQKLDEQSSPELVISENITLSIEYTKVATVIDINFKGKPCSSGIGYSKENNFKDANLIAAKHIVRLIKLHIITGQVIIDVLRVASKKYRDQLIDLYKSLILEFNIPAKVAGFSNLGLLELEVSKNRFVGADITACSYCHKEGLSINNSVKILVIKAFVQINSLIETEPLRTVKVVANEYYLNIVERLCIENFSSNTVNVKINFVADCRYKHEIVVY